VTDDIAELQRAVATLRGMFSSQVGLRERTGLYLGIRAVEEQIERLQAANRARVFGDANGADSNADDGGDPFLKRIKTQLFDQERA
jgi:hypothetical protein